MEGYIACDVLRHPTVIPFQAGFEDLCAGANIVLAILQFLYKLLQYANPVLSRTVLVHIVHSPIDLHRKCLEFDSPRMCTLCVEN